jgi:hypothetical protein
VRSRPAQSRPSSSHIPSTCTPSHGTLQVPSKPCARSPQPALALPSSPHSSSSLLLSSPAIPSPKNWTGTITETGNLTLSRSLKNNKELLHVVVDQRDLVVAHHQLHHVCLYSSFGTAHLGCESCVVGRVARSEEVGWLVSGRRSVLPGRQSRGYRKVLQVLGGYLVYLGES